MNVTKKIKLLDFSLTKSLGNSFFGLYKSNFKGNGIDFVEHKEYSFSDPLKSIDWKASSKSDKIYSKIYEEERDLNVLFVIDINKNINFGVYDKTKKDILEEVFFTIAASSNMSGDSIATMLYDGEKQIFIPFKKGFGNIFKTISELENKSNFSVLDPDRTSKIITFLNKLNTKNTLIFFISDDLNLKIDKNIKLLGYNNQIIYLNIFDHFENNLSNIGLDLSLNNGNSFLNISLNDNSKIEKYKKTRNISINKFNDMLIKNGVYYKNLDTKNDIFRELFLFFSKIKK
ncbi:MAG: DUF58 domain-containing protein [Candidatus Gracilibacteria bacterium]|nr:DUF58 domain-containing protein [Candidatus Gracilibacteria bacterium]